MDEGLKTILLWLFGGFTIIDIIRLLVARGRQCRVIEEHDERIDTLEKQQKASEKELSMLKESTSIRLATIELEIKNLHTSIIDLSKDVKQLLRVQLYGED